MSTPRSQGNQQAVSRTREPERRRADILAAARAVFAERGYARATIREIARRAGVTHGLIVMHFSTKEQLFIAAVPGTRDLALSLDGDPDELPDRVASSFVRRMESADSADPFIALVRTAASDEQAARPLLQQMWSESLAAYAKVLPGPDLAIKVDMIGALLIGVTFSRYVVKQGPLATADAETLAAFIAQALRGIIGAKPHGN